MIKQGAEHVRRSVRAGADLGREATSLLRERRLHRPAPPATGLVLDLGAGDAPHPRADVVVDKYVVDDFERGGDLVFTRPVVVADGEALPFADNAFDYVIASHVLEHAIDPTTMSGELSRVSSAGFVQLPTAAAELVYGWPFHPWLVELDGGHLRFRPKEQEAPISGRLAHDAYEESLLTRLGWAAHRSRWHHSVHWTGRLEVTVEGERRFHEQAQVDADRTADVLKSMAAAGGLVPLDDHLRSLLRCPVRSCRSPLEWQGEQIRCTGCAREFQAPGGVPVLLVEDSAQSGAPCQ